MSYPLYVVFGILPSFVWLMFYLRKDHHPEAHQMVLRIFFWGMIIALPAVFLEMGFFDIVAGFRLPSGPASFLNIFIGVAFMEEFLKYLIVQNRVLSHHEFDEPVDAIIYMIVAALGFAAAENILILLQLGHAVLWDKAIEISAFRFLGATFLHTLSSGLIGFFLALAILEKKNRTRLIVFGLSLATLLHGLYNFSIMKIQGNFKILIPILILFGLAVFLSFAFKRLH
ncbi:MAG: PrsW family intramembrane metalloprotease, partial [Candidatus Nealsonbacteria bacterium]|nr:PrsW family intramembrane metalloprotease [Candidatus Nealsonbacteria bacterium]